MQADPTKIVGSIVVLIEALLAALVASGFLMMDNETLQLWVNVAAAGGMVVTPWIGFWLVRKNATPSVAPKDTDGAALMRADGSKPLAQIAYEAK